MLIYEGKIACVVTMSAYRFETANPPNPAKAHSLEAKGASNESYSAVWYYGNKDKLATSIQNESKQSDAVFSRKPCR